MDELGNGNSSPIRARRFPSQPHAGTPCKACPRQNLRLVFVERKYIKRIHNEVNKNHHRTKPPKPSVLQPQGPCNLGVIFTPVPCCLHTHGLLDLCLLLTQHLPDLDLPLHSFCKISGFCLTNFSLPLSRCSQPLPVLCDQSLLRLPTVVLSFFCGIITWKLCRTPSAAPSCPSAPIPHHNLLLLLCGARQWVCLCSSVPSAPFL